MSHMKNGKSNVRFVPIMYSYAPISHFCNVFRWMDVSSAKAISFTCFFHLWFLMLVCTLHTLVVARSGKLRQALRSIKSNLSVNRVCMKFECTLRKSPILQYAVLLTFQWGTLRDVCAHTLMLHGGASIAPGLWRSHSLPSLPVLSSWLHCYLCRTENTKEEKHSTVCL